MRYTTPSGVPRSFTIPLNERNMFTMRTKSGYNAFICKACEYDPTWQVFPGAVHIISDDDDVISPLTTYEMREPSMVSPLTTDKMRESSHVIPFVHEDFDYQPSAPVDTDFSFPSSSSPLEEEPQVASVFRKQHLLAVLHELFEYLHFPFCN